MELRIGKLVLSRRGLQLIVFAGFIQGLFLGAFLAGDMPVRSGSAALLLVFALLSLLAFYSLVKKEVYIRK